MTTLYKKKRPQITQMKQFFMKRLLSMFISLVCFITTAGAQIGEYRSEFSIGGGGGYVLSQVGFMPEVPQKQHIGMMGGLAFRYTCEKYFSSVCAVIAEMNFVQAGWKEDLLTPEDNPVINAITGSAEQFEHTINYLQIPVFARLGWGRERRGVQAFFQAGPQIGILLGESTKSNFKFNEMNLAERTSKIVAQDTMSVERKFDYGITAGIGLEISLPSIGHILVEGRYYYGLGDIYRNSKRDYFGRSNLTNIVIKMTYLFDFKKSNNPKIK